MKKDVYNVNEALVLLKEGLVLKDSVGAIYKIKNKRVSVYNTNSSFSILDKEFIDLYKDKMFIVDVGDDVNIDILKDEEYYNFKHK